MSLLKILATSARLMGALGRTLPVGWPLLSVSPLTIPSFAKSKMALAYGFDAERSVKVIDTDEAEEEDMLVADEARLEREEDEETEEVEELTLEREDIMLEALMPLDAADETAPLRLETLDDTEDMLEEEAGMSLMPIASISVWMTAPRVAGWCTSGLPRYTLKFRCSAVRT